MRAVIELQGKQYKIEEGDKIVVDSLDAEPGDEISIDKVLLIEDDKGVKVGKPYIKGKSITGKVIEHTRGKKIVVFKMRRRKHFRKKTGHRQEQTVVQIESIASAK